MNEATLEARVSEVLRQVFPTFKEVNVVHQTSFTLKIGHHNIPFDSDYSNKNSVRGISDIILKIDDKNIILLELKQENIVISQADIAQGLSYARLLDQMPPITLISNGKDNQFFNTYTRDEIVIDTIDFQFIQKTINSSFTLAASDFKDAVNLLLNNDPELFSKVINDLSEARFNRLTGDIADFSKPICLDFNIERTILEEINKVFDNGNLLVGIQASAFVGKTTVLYQFFQKLRSTENFLLYLDCNDHNYSIYKQLANSFSKSSGVHITEEKVREWLNSSLYNGSGNRLYLLLDNFNDNIAETIKEEILELIDLFDNGHHRILYTIDEFNYKEIAYVPHRKYKTLIGQKSKVIKLDELDDIEYMEANEIMFDRFRLIIQRGGHFTPEYREPRILRHLITAYQDEQIPDKNYSKLIAVPDYELLTLLVCNETYSPEVHQLMKKLADCFIEEHDTRQGNSDLALISIGTGAILTETFRAKYPNDYESLIQSSIVVIREYHDQNLSIIYPKLPELLAYYCIDKAVHLLLEKSKDTNGSELATYFTDLMLAIPFCDIVGAGTMMQLSQKAPLLFSDLITELRKIAPKTELIGKGTIIAMHVPEEGTAKINFDCNVDKGNGFFIADFYPYAILSQLAGYPMGVDDPEDEGNYKYHLLLIYQLASDSHFLRRADMRSIKNMKYLEGHDWDGIGQIINGKEGIIEPIVQSIQKCFMQLPDQMILLSKYGFHQKNFNMLYRFYLALEGLTNFADKNISEKAVNFVKEFHTFFTEFMAEYLSKDIPDRKEREALYNKLLKLDIAEELNRKYL